MYKIYVARGAGFAGGILYFDPFLGGVYFFRPQFRGGYTFFVRSLGGLYFFRPKFRGGYTFFGRSLGGYTFFGRDLGGGILISTNADTILNVFRTTFGVFMLVFWSIYGDCIRICSTSSNV